MNKDTDVMLRKLFIGGLPFHTTDKTLREHFEQYGGIDEAVVISDRTTGKSKGYGFVTMADNEAAEKACAMKNPTIDGRKANVNLAYLGAKPRRAVQMPNGALAAAGYMPLTSYGAQAGPGAGLPMDPVQQQHLAYQQAYLQQMHQFQHLQQLQQQQLALAAGGQAATALAANGLQQMFHPADYGQHPQHVLANGAAGYGAQSPAAGFGPMMGATAATSIPIPQHGSGKFDQMHAQYGQSPNLAGFAQPGTSPVGGSYPASPQLYMPH